MSTSSLTFEFPVRSNSWPVGFGFRPTEEELITHYLHNKMLGNHSLAQYIREVDLNNYDPHQLPELSNFESGNHEWFFFRAESDLYHNNNISTITKTRTKRTTATGFWKSTGDDKQIKARGTNKIIGYRKILVFHRGKNPRGVRTNWIIHEYRLHLQHTHLPYNYKRSFVVCRLKEDADQVSTFDNDEQNHSVTSRVKRKVRRTGIQEVSSETRAANGPSVFESEPANSKPQSAGGYDGQFTQPEAPTLTDMLKYVYFEDDDVTSKNNYGASNEEEVEEMIHELWDGGISSVTDNHAAFNLQNNDISPSWFDDLGSLGVHMPTIKQSRRSPLRVKHLRHEYEEEDVYELQGGLSSVSSGSGISMNSDYSDDGPESKDLVSKAISQYKAKEDEKLVSPTSQLSITDSSNVRTSDGRNKYGCVDSKGRGFSYILTTKQIHHKSSVPLVYVAKAFLGIIMFFLFVQEMLLYGSWC